MEAGMGEDSRRRVALMLFETAAETAGLRRCRYCICTTNMMGGMSVLVRNAL